MKDTRTKKEKTPGISVEFVLHQVSDNKRELQDEAKKLKKDYMVNTQIYPRPGGDYGLFVSPVIIKKGVRGLIAKPGKGETDYGFPRLED